MVTPIPDGQTMPYPHGDGQSGSSESNVGLLGGVHSAETGKRMLEPCCRLAARLASIDLLFEFGD